MPKALIVEILGDARQFGAELDKAAGKTRQMSRVAGVAGLALAGGLAYGLEKSVKAAEAGQESTARLEQAFKNSGESAGNYAKQIEEAESSGRKLGFTNVETKNALGSLEIATHNGAKAIGDLGVAADIARFKHISLEGATKMLAMAMSGSQRAVKQLGLSIQPTTENMDALKEKYKALGQHIPPAEAAQAKFLDKQATGAAVIDLVSKKLAGQAQAYSDTAAGGMQQFHAQIDALMESLGAALLPALTSVSGGLADMAGFFAHHTTIVKLLVVGLGVLAVTLITVSAATKVLAAGQAVAKAATVLWTAAQWLLNAALEANPIGLVVIAIGLLVAAIVIAYTHVDSFRNLFHRAFEAIKDAAQSVMNFFRTNWPIIAVLISGPFAPLVALATNAFGIRSALTGAFEGVKSAVSDKIGDVVGFIRALPGKIVAALGNVSTLLFNAGSEIIGGLISGLTSRLGEVEHLASSIAHKIASLKGPIEYDRQLLVPHGEAIIEGLQTGMENKLVGVLSGVSGFAPRIAGAVGSAGAASAGGGAGGSVHVTVQGWVGDEAALAFKLRDTLVKHIGQPNGTVFGDFA